MTSNVWRGKKETREPCGCGSGLNATVYYSVIKTAWVKQCRQCRDAVIAGRTKGITVMVSTDQDKRNAKARKLIEEWRDRVTIYAREVWEERVENTATD